MDFPLKNQQEKELVRDPHSQNENSEQSSIGLFGLFHFCQHISVLLAFRSIADSIVASLYLLCEKLKGKERKRNSLFHRIPP